MNTKRNSKFTPINISVETHTSLNSKINIKSDFLKLKFSVVVDRLKVCYNYMN